MELMTQLRSEDLGQGRVISAIKVNGIQISDDDETSLANLLLSEIETVELLTTDGRSLAADTLETLEPFVVRLSHIAQTAAVDGDLSRLIEGAAILSETVAGVRAVLSQTPSPEADSLEIEFRLILGDLLAEVEGGRDGAMILATRLPAHLEQWIKVGIPALRKLCSN